MFIVLLIATNWCLKMRRHSVLSFQMDKICVKTFMFLLRYAQRRSGFSKMYKKKCQKYLAVLVTAISMTIAVLTAVRLTVDE